MLAQSCPETNLLRRFLDAELADEQNAAIYAHLETCLPCLQTLEEMSAHDPADALTCIGQAYAELPRGKQVDELIARLQVITSRSNLGIHADTVARTGSDTHPGSPESGEKIPDKFGRYHILARLGAGGMGTVYKGVDPDLGRAVAIKVPRLPEGGRRSEAVQRFLREARLAAGIRHPHVCPIYDVGEHESNPYVVMAFIDGKPLSQEIKERPFELGAIVELLQKTAHGLEAIRQQGIIHRDLKPGNVLLDRTGEPVLTDFGLARPLEDVEHLTSTDAVLGTPAYMSLEQASGDNDRVGPSSDIYSLGVMLYQLLTGRLPFEGPTVMSLLYKIRNETPLPPSTHVPNLDRGLEKIVLKAMAREAKDRYQNAAELIEALSSWSEHPRPAPKVRSDRPARRLLGAAAAMLLAIGAVVAYQVIIQIQRPDRKTTDLTVPDGSKVDIDAKGNAVVKLPKEQQVQRQPALGRSPLDALDASLVSVGKSPFLKLPPAW